MLYQRYFIIIHSLIACALAALENTDDYAQQKADSLGNVAPPGYIARSAHVVLLKQNKVAQFHAGFYNPRTQQWGRLYARYMQVMAREGFEWDARTCTGDFAVLIERKSGWSKSTSKLTKNTTKARQVKFQH